MSQHHFIRIRRKPLHAARPRAQRRAITAAAKPRPFLALVMETLLDFGAAVAVRVWNEAPDREAE
jgi:hypothetical protein